MNMWGDNWFLPSDRQTRNNRPPNSQFNWRFPKPNKNTSNVQNTMTSINIELKDQIQLLEQRVSYLKGHIQDLKRKNSKLQSQRKKHHKPRVDPLAKRILEINRKLMKKMESNIDQSLYCSICYENYKNAALDPCGHVYCITCITKLYPKKKCPQCRNQFTKYLKIFI